MNNEYKPFVIGVKQVRVWLIPVRYEESEGLEKLVPDPFNKNHYLWIPF